jgi:hypothetical protein
LDSVQITGGSSGDGSSHDRGSGGGGSKGSDSGSGSTDSHDSGGGGSKGSDSGSDGKGTDHGGIGSTTGGDVGGDGDIGGKGGGIVGPGGITGPGIGGGGCAAIHTCTPPPPGCHFGRHSNFDDHHHHDHNHDHVDVIHKTVVIHDEHNTPQNIIITQNAQGTCFVTQSQILSIPNIVQQLLDQCTTILLLPIDSNHSSSFKRV